MSGSIRLHSKLGVNPKLTYCPRCKGESNELVLVGADDGKYKCRSCGLHIYGYGKGKCPKCDAGHTLERIGTVEEHERLPATRPCDGCRAELDEHGKVVAEGGVYFKCKDCNATGAIRASAPLAGAVREKAGVAAPAPCGVEFSKADCPACGPNNVKGNSK